MNSKDFYRALSTGQLIGSHCQTCGMRQVPQRKICPQCYTASNEIVNFSGKGTLAAYTIIRVPPRHMAAAGYDAKNPYCVGIVELDEGPNVAAQILDVDTQDPTSIKIGMPLRMTTIRRAEDASERSYLAFVPG